MDIPALIRSMRERLSPGDATGNTPDVAPAAPARESAPGATTWRTEFLSLTLPAEFSLKFHGSSVQTDPLWPGPRIPRTAPKPVVPAPPPPNTADPSDLFALSGPSDPFDPCVELSHFDPGPPDFGSPNFSPPDFAPPSAIEDIWNWEGAAERELRLTVWKPRAPYPGGPMRAAETWTEIVAGSEVTVTRTSLFFGLPQEALVIHLNLVSPRAQVLFFARHLDRAEFSAIVSSIQLTGNSIEPRFSPPKPVPFPLP